MAPRAEFFLYRGQIRDGRRAEKPALAGGSIDGLHLPAMAALFAVSKSATSLADAFMPLVRGELAMPEGGRGASASVPSGTSQERASAISLAAAPHSDRRESAQPSRNPRFYDCCLACGRPILPLLKISTCLSV